MKAEKLYQGGILSRTEMKNVRGGDKNPDPHVCFCQYPPLTIVLDCTSPQNCAEMCSDTCMDAASSN